MRDAQYYKDRIAMLEGDIEVFGPAGDDLQRLAMYRQELKEIEEQQPGDSDHGNV